MAPPTKQSSKPVFKTSSPFTETKWPQISQNDQEIILDLVCNLISPIGDHRRAHVHPSRGKKRKRKNSKDQIASNQPEFQPSPSPPEIGNHILVGLNSVTRHLETLAARNAPSSMPVSDSLRNAEVAETLTTKKSPGNGDDQASRKEEETKPLSMVILTHPNPTLSPAHVHLPTLVHLSTLPLPYTSIPDTTIPTSPPTPSSDPTTRLLPLPTSADARLASKLHIPRVGALAIFRDAPGAKVLETFVMENVERTECRWIDEALQAQWRGLNVKGSSSGGKK